MLPVFRVNLQFGKCGADATPHSQPAYTGDLLCLFDSRHRHSGDPEVHGAEEVPVGEIECLPIRTAEGDVGCLRLAMDDPPKLLALRIQNPDATRAATIDVSGTVHFHSVRGTPGSVPRRSANTRSVCRANVPFGAISNARMCPRRVGVCCAVESAAQAGRGQTAD